jgi:hypothetical protein
MTTANILSQLGSAGVSTGFKNRIINGAMMISQRGTTFSTPASGSYNLDRWFVVWGGAAPASIAQVTGPTGFKNALQITGAASNTSVNIQQRIEPYNCSDLSGASVTIQANIAASTSQTIVWQLLYPTAQDNYTSSTLISSGSWSATSTATTFSATISNLPSGATNGLVLIIFANGGGALTSGTVTITGVQLEVGTTATNFDYRPYGTELSLCQRYFAQMNSGPALYTAFSAGQVVNGAVANMYTKYPVTMRSQPTITISGLIVNSGGGSFSTTTQTMFAGYDTALLQVGPGSGLTVGYGAVMYANNSATAYMSFSAEL